MPSGSGVFPRQIGARLRCYHFSSGGDYCDSLQLVDESGGTWTRSSVTTPRFKSKIHLDLPMNPFSFVSTRRVGNFGIRRLTQTNLTTGSVSVGEERGFYAAEGAPILSSTVMARVRQKASTKLLSELKNQDFNLGVALGEGHATISLIAQKARQIAKAGLQLRKLNFSGAADALFVPVKPGAVKRSHSQSLAQNWLELQYGWQPLLNDCYGAAKTLASLNGKIHRTRVQTTAKEETSRKDSSASNSSTIENLLETGTYNVKYVVYFSEPTTVNLPYALGLENPLAIAWELVPFSFVVDWFLPIGSFLDTIDATKGLVFVKGCVTEFYKGEITTVRSSAPPFVVGNERNEFYVRENYFTEHVSCVRGVLQAFPLPTIPQFKNPVSLIHAANAVALLAQVFSGAPVKSIRI